MLTSMHSIVFLILCSIIVAILFAFNLKEWKGKFLNPLSVIYILTFCVSLFESIAYAVNGKQNLIWLNYASNMLNFACIATIGLCTLWYSNEQLSIVFFKKKAFKIIVFVPYIINIISIALAPKFNIVFGINANGEYYRSPTYFMQLIPYGYLIFTMIASIQRYIKIETTLTKNRYKSIFYMASVPIFMGGIVLIFPSIGFDLVEYSITISLLLNFIVTQNNKITRDSLTKLMNKEYFSSMLYEKMSKKHNQNNLYLLMCDIDNFKSINDIYGHLEGDDALIVFSQTLTEVCSLHYATPARVGGDEFSIIIEAASREEVDKFIDEIHQELAIKTQNKKYNLVASIGYAQYRESDNINDLYKAADRMLYKVKNAKKSSVSGGKSTA